MTQSPPTTPQAEQKPDFTGWVHNHAATGWKKVAELRLEISKLNRVIAKKNRKILSLKADLAQPRAVEKVEHLEYVLTRYGRGRTIPCDKGYNPILTMDDLNMLLRAAEIVAAQQKKAGS